MMNGKLGIGAIVLAVVTVFGGSLITGIQQWGILHDDLAEAQAAILKLQESMVELQITAGIHHADNKKR